MNNTTKSALNLWATGGVTRYHVHPSVMHQKTSEHQWGVAVLIMTAHPNPSIALIKEAIAHDAGEKISGDTPYPAKAKYPELRELLNRVESDARSELGAPAQTLTEEERRWLKWADMAECGLYSKSLWTECGYACARHVAYTAAVVLIKEHSGLSEVTDEINAFIANGL